MGSLEAFVGCVVCVVYSWREIRVQVECAGSVSELSF